MDIASVDEPSPFNILGEIVIKLDFVSKALT